MNQRLFRSLIIFFPFFNPQINSAFFRFIETFNFEKQYFNFKLYEVKNVLQIQKIDFLNTKSKKIKSPKFFTYLPINLQNKFYRQLLISYFKNITFTEIKSSLILNYSSKDSSPIPNSSFSDSSVFKSSCSDIKLRRILSSVKKSNSYLILVGNCPHFLKGVSS